MKKKKELVKEVSLQDYYKEIEEMKNTAEAAEFSEQENDAEITVTIKVKEK